MQQKGLVLDVIIYGFLINTRAKGYIAEKSLQLLVEMQRKGLVLDVIIYGTLINARAKGYIAEKALQLLLEMQRKGLELDVFIYTALSSIPVPRATLLRSPCSFWW